MTTKAAAILFGERTHNLPLYLSTNLNTGDIICPPEPQSHDDLSA